MNILHLALLMCVSIEPHFAEVGTPPKDGQYYIAYDFDVEGQLLKIDLIKSVAEVLGQLPPDLANPRNAIEGYYLPRLKIAWLLVRKPEEESKYRLYRWALPHGSPVKTSLDIDLAGDICLVPLSATYFLAKDGTSSVAFDYQDDSAKVLPYELPLFPDISFNELATYAYLSPGFLKSARTIRIIETAGPYRSEKISLDSLAPPELADKVWFKDIDPPYLLISLSPPQSKSRRWGIVNMKMKKTVLVTTLAPTYTADYFLHSESPQSFAFSSVKKTLRAGQYHSTGILVRTEIQKDTTTAVEVESREYEPIEQLVVEGPSEDLEIIPHRQYDYVSRDFIQPNPLNNYALAPASQEELQERISERKLWLENNLNKQIVQDTIWGPRKVVIVKLRIER